MAVTLMLALLSAATLLLLNTSLAAASGASPCDTVSDGYQCSSAISHNWGQYSPFFSVPSTIPHDLPAECQITFVQVLSRHGARDPTASKTADYNQTIQKIHDNVSSFTGPYAFLADYEYTLGADQLTPFGEQQMINSGINFYHRYQPLTSQLTPFVRSSGEERVVASAENFTQGFHTAKQNDPTSHGHAPYPYPILVIPEESGINNTLDHGLCTAFEDGPVGDIADDAQETWAGTFVPPIRDRLNQGLPGANLSITEVVYMMDLCPFNTVALPDGLISPFCSLFTEQEWHQYSYYETLNKYYGYSYGNPLGPTQGVGFSNELIARLTDEPVNDRTSTNKTLDDSSDTFPLQRKLYVDVSHDNDMTAIFSALGLYQQLPPLPNTTVVEPEAAYGYSAAWTVAFAARAYFEKMTCTGHEEELVRILINDRVLPLEQCGGDEAGRCPLSAFIDSLEFVKKGGEWDQCFS